MESFYINLKLGKDEKEFVVKEIGANTIYKKGIAFADWKNGDETSIIGSTFSFLPACYLMYKLCCDISKRKAGFVFETYGEEKVFDFENKEQFVAFMYSKWGAKLDGVAEQLGVFLIHPTNAYKALRKLKKKYFTKF